ncbi:MAG: hypothetical protein ISQ34_01740 [Rickettsiales bacterium]|nr:hypothetical protein [Rickettsiales bacterium]
MPVLSKFNQQLIDIYNAWKNLSENDRKRKINLILPIIQIVSISQSLGNAHNELTPIHNPELEKKIPGEYADFYKNPNQTNSIISVLRDFHQFYQESYGQDIAKTNHSDFTETLRSKIDKLQNNVITSTQELEDEIISYSDKYIHAHSRIMLNYGEFLYKIIKTQRIAIRQLIYQTQTTDNENEFISKIQTLIRDLNLEEHYRIIEGYLDDLENHALLNQMSNWLENALTIPKLILQERHVVIEALQTNRSLKSEQNITRRKDYQESIATFNHQLHNLGMQSHVGIESEFLLSLFEGQTHSTIERPEFIKRYIAIKETLADYNARRYMKVKYGINDPHQEITDFTTFFRDESDFKEEISPHHTAIKKRLQEFFEHNKIDQARQENIARQVLALSDAEIYFFNLFFLNDLGYPFHIEMDSVFSPSLTPDQNLEKVLSLIEKGKFHEKLLDMIQAHEIAFGPYEFIETIDKKNELHKLLRSLAEEIGLKVENPNLQLNLSFQINIDGRNRHIFMPDIENLGTKEPINIYYNGLAVKLLSVMQDTIASLGPTTGLLRNQENIGTALDRKKVLSTIPNVGEYFKVDETQPAFLSHKSLAAKNDTLRLSVLDLEKGVGILEIRLIGNNTHFARFNDEERVNSSSLFYIPEEALPAIAKNMTEFLSTQTKKSLKSLYDEKHFVTHDGRITNLHPSQVKHKKEPSNTYKTERIRAGSIDFTDTPPTSLSYSPTNAAPLEGEANKQGKYS